jgi:Fe-S cluster assembly iron-binding protein IscA
MFGWLRRLLDGSDPVAGRPRARGVVPPFPAEFIARGRREPERRSIIAVAPAAAAEVRRAAAHLSAWVVRIQIVVTAFDGIRPTTFQERVEIDTRVDPETDYLDDTHGVPVVVDRRTAQYMAGAILDWEPRIGFALRQPGR